MVLFFFSFFTFLQALSTGPLPPVSYLRSEPELHHGPPLCLTTPVGCAPLHGDLLYTSCLQSEHQVSGQISQDCPLQGCEPGQEAKE